MNQFTKATRIHLFAVMLISGAVLCGCDNKETVLDVDTPDGGVEVQRDLDNGELSVDVED
ncbi:hypothetical protein [Rhodopirellula sallentina]|uniref:Signal peptide protein n=1 Tax=Rhodopirellula sallentina SM41 TaxID=1263870 RepID=M5U7W2_9BACT|nr:hypothetical protein [Rhodopirellula sallentina]EMI57552.1 signal peptide protein [Rhodopirellula sallentina SM41]